MRIKGFHNELGLFREMCATTLDMVVNILGCKRIVVVENGDKSGQKRIIKCANALNGNEMRRKCVISH